MPAYPLKAKPVNRGGVWYFYRRVPSQYAHIDPRKTVSISTGIPIWQDPHGQRASELVQQYDQSLQAYWRNSTVGQVAIDPHTLHSVKARAQQLNHTYMPTESLLGLQHTELFARFQALGRAYGFDTLSKTSPTPPIQHDATALLGLPLAPTPQTSDAEEEPLIMASAMLNEFERINAAMLAQKSERQLAKWKVRRQSALDIFLKCIGGDKPFLKLTRADAHKFRNHWQTRIKNGEIRINSANRHMTQLIGLYACLKDYLQLDGPSIFEKLRIRGGKDGKRLAFPTDFVQSHFLAEGVFDSMNEEARRIVFLIIETGIRLSEACALTEQHIHLNSPIPHIEILPYGRQLKTDESTRILPLVGVALKAMQAQPCGFPRYYDKADAASAIINKHLDNKGLRPGGAKQPLYSMRHTIADRLRDANAPTAVIEAVHGHKYMYGEGLTLERVHMWMKQIAFKPPANV